MSRPSPDYGDQKVQIAPNPRQSSAGRELVLGLNVSTQVGIDPIAAARRAEEEGFDFISVNDHLHGPDPSHETWTLLTWIAAHTSRIRVASRVIAVPYRNPAVLAKMTETLHRLSQGRFILGLGGGASDEEFRAFGLPARTPGEKVRGLEEAARIARGLWSEPRFTFTGSTYSTFAAELEPKPQSRIAIWFGTYGDRALTATGRYADGWIPSLGYASPEQVVRMRDRVMRAARNAGRRSEEIACIYNLEVHIGEDAPARPDLVSGSPASVLARLWEFIDLGFTGFNLIPAGPDVARQAERLGREVIPALRAGYRSRA